MCETRRSCSAEITVAVASSPIPAIVVFGTSAVVAGVVVSLRSIVLVLMGWWYPMLDRTKPQHRRFGRPEPG
jgi:hypothetical protein